MLTAADKWKVMVVEDDAPVRHLITASLSAEDYTVIAAQTAAEAVHLATTRNPYMILLDLGLPDGDGVEVIKQIRVWTETPIIVISARDEDTDKIEALDAGADDYLTKPFSVAELLARLRATQRRLAYLAAGNTDAVFRNGDLVIDYAAGRAYLAGQELKLTSIEYRLLCLLAQNVGKILTHKYITQKIWGIGWENNIASLRVFMATLRKKLETSQDSPTYIQTQIGVGYRMLKL